MQPYSYLLRKCTVTAALGVAGLALNGPLAAQVGLGLVPMRVEFPATPGRPYSGSLTLSNGTSAKQRVRVELLDLYVDETMTPQFVPSAPREADYSCRSWLSINPMEMEVSPMSQVPVRYTVHVPAGAVERSFHCAIGFRTLPTVTEASGTGMLTAVRMIAAIYPIVGKPPVRGEIKDLQLEQVRNAESLLWRAVVVMDNSGWMLYRPAGDVELLDDGGNVIESQKLPSFPALPQRRQRYLVQFKSGLTPGSYTLRARIEVGGEIQEASAKVAAGAPPPPAEVPEVPAQ